VVLMVRAAVVPTARATTVLMAWATRTMTARPMAVLIVRAAVVPADRAVGARPVLARCLMARV
jgi:hypothetical protein